jgi:cytosine/adenosine deaminase-related metal-dependent hydrolase
LRGGFDALHALLFVNNPSIASRLLNVELGQLVIGAPADVILLEYEPPTPLDTGSVLGHLLFGAAVHTLRVSDSFVAGRPILRDGAFVNIDEQATYAHAREQAAALWKRIG